MRTKSYNVYEFNELSDEAKARAKKDWYEDEEYSMLSDDLSEYVKSLLDEANCSYEDIKVLYSLSYSQGDGLCFTGSIMKNDVKLVLSHSYRYYFANSVTMNFYDKTGEEVDEIPELKEIYFDVCAKAEKSDYATIEYRMTDKEFDELCQENNYEFTEDGKLDRNMK